MQNEMLKVMALQILRDVAANIRNSTFFSIMADETTDKTNREQVVIFLRWMDDNLLPHEDSIGMHKVDKIDAETIKTVILDVNESVYACRSVEGNATMDVAQWPEAKEWSQQ